MSQASFLLPLTAFLYGARHALEPDHLAAVSTMAAHGESKRRVLLIAIAWGAGHAAVILAAGALLARLRWEIPDWFLARSEGAVGLMMVAFGAWMVLRRPRPHIHRHAHDGQPAHSHFHLHQERSAQNHIRVHDQPPAQARSLPAPRTATHPHPPAPSWMARPIAAFAVGSLHGFLGTGPVVALAAIAAPSFGGTTVYLLAFGAGSLIGMVAAVALALYPLLLVTSGAVWSRRLLHATAGIASIVTGLLLVRSVM